MKVSADRPHINDFLRLVVVVLSSVLAILYLWSPEGQTLHGGSILFAKIEAFRRVLPANLVWIIVLAFMPRLVVFLDVFMFLQVFFLGFLGAQVAYQYYPPCPEWFSFLPDWAQSYMLSHGAMRAYLIIPLILLGVLFFTYPPGKFRSLFHTGNFKKRTGLFGPAIPWSKAIIRILLWLALLFIVFLVIRHNDFILFGTRSFWDGITRLLAIIIYAGIVAVCEEILYRGMLLSVLANSFKPRAAIIIQAILFAFVHYVPGIPVIISLGSMAVLGFLGWLLGKMAWDTGGIAPNLIVHFSLIMLLALLGA
ncbi:MAG: CPBP family intramembrane metalloprotease [Candidatus Eremiobacteraeota bacterium]|nr:CPBP family intramembrane metalloprotease [Candidatus Eremiobacteraeota bacterium]